MPAKHFFASRPEEVGLDSAKVEELISRAEREVKEGLLPSAQVAIARNGKIAAMRTFGHAVQGGVDKPATNERDFFLHQGDHLVGAVDSHWRRQARRAKTRRRVHP